MVSGYITYCITAKPYDSGFMIWLLWHSFPIKTLLLITSANGVYVDLFISLIFVCFADFLMCFVRFISWLQPVQIQIEVFILLTTFKRWMESQESWRKWSQILA